MVATLKDIAQEQKSSVISLPFSPKRVLGPPEKLHTPFNLYGIRIFMDNFRLHVGVVVVVEVSIA